VLVRHAMVSAVQDGVNTSVVRPSDWNAAHVVEDLAIEDVTGLRDELDGIESVTVISADVVNNNAVADTLADVAGLSFPVVAGATYWFEFVIPYTAAANTTGSRWCLNGPALTSLFGTAEWTLAETTRSFATFSSYNAGAANSTSLAAGSVSVIRGVIRCSAVGSVVARFSSERASEAITAKAGACVRWRKVLP